MEPVVKSDPELLIGELVKFEGIRFHEHLTEEQRKCLAEKAGRKEPKWYDRFRRGY